MTAASQKITESGAGEKVCCRPLGHVESRGTRDETSRSPNDLHEREILRCAQDDKTTWVFHQLQIVW